MANLVKPLSFCSALLLLSAVCWHLTGNDGVAATNCLSGIKSVFGSSKLTGYEKLAKYLFQQTPSSLLSDNTAQAAKLLCREERVKDRQKDYELKYLIMVFSQINDTNKEQLCAMSTLREVRMMVDAMARYTINNMGQTKSKGKITDSVRRLNEIIIRLVERASYLCWEHLESKFPASWEPRFSFADMPSYIAQLDELPSELIYTGYLGELDSSSSQESSRARWEVAVAERVAKIITADQLLYSKSHTVHLAWTQDSLVGLIERYIRKPCVEFEKLYESESILKPYMDLLLATLAISPGIGAMDKFYQSDPSEYRPRVLHWQHNEEVLKQAKRVKACDLLYANIAPTRLAKLVMQIKSGPLDS